MNLRELYEELGELIGSLEDGEADGIEVLLAHQRNYPLAFSLETITHDMTEPEKPVLWLAEGGHPDERSPYAPRHAWDGGEVFPDDDEDEESELSGREGARR
jgi:hypothetical protein